MGRGECSYNPTVNWCKSCCHLPAESGELGYLRQKNVADYCQCHSNQRKRQKHISEDFQYLFICLHKIYNKTI